MNCIAYRGPAGYQWARFDNVDIAVAVEATDGDVDIAFANVVRNVDERGVEDLG